MNEIKNPLFSKEVLWENPHNYPNEIKILRCIMRNIFPANPNLNLTDQIPLQEIRVSVRISFSSIGEKI